MRDERRVTVKVPGDLHKAVRVKAIEEGVVLSDLVRAWLAGWLSDDQQAEPKPHPPQGKPPT